MILNNNLFNNDIQFNEKEPNITYLISQSKYKLLNFKNDLYKLYQIIFKICAKNNIIISNYNINLSKCNNKEFQLSDLDKDFEFCLLSSNPYKDGIEISNNIYNSYSKYVTMTSYIKNKELIISIDNNKIIKLHLLFLYSDQLTNKIKNINFNTFNLKLDNVLISDLLNSNNLYELLILSHSLYNPSYFLKYYKELKNTERNTKSYNNLYDNLLQSVLKDYDKNMIIKKNNNNVSETFRIRKNLLNQLNKETSELQIILLDTYSIEYLLAFLNNNIKINIDLFNFDDMLHIIISSRYIELIKNIINSSIDTNDFNLIIKTNVIYIMNDFRLKRYNLSLLNKNNGKKITIGYCYNSLDYEVIPTIAHIKDNLYIPHPFVLIRFLIINLYYVKLFDPSYNKESNNKFLYKCQYLYEILIKYNIQNINDTIINYIGLYIDDRIDKFQLGTLVYRPWQYYIKHNKLLLID